MSLEKIGIAKARALALALAGNGALPMMGPIIVLLHARFVVQSRLGIVLQRNPVRVLGEVGVQVGVLKRSALFAIRKILGRVPQKPIVNLLEKNGAKASKGICIVRIRARLVLKQNCTIVLIRMPALGLAENGVGNIVPRSVLCVLVKALGPAERRVTALHLERSGVVMF